MKRSLAVLLIFAVATSAPARGKFDNATKARIDGNYAKVLFKDGHKGVFPLKDLANEDLAAVTKLAEESPLPAGNTRVESYVPTKAKRVTIVKREMKDGTETVELNTPSSIHDQGQAPTCRYYAFCHALDIAGYFIDVDRIINWQRVPETTDQQREALQKISGGDNGWGSTALLEGDVAAAAARLCPQATYHYISMTEVTQRMEQTALASANTPDKKLRAYFAGIGQAANWDWIREQIRQGRPVLAVLISDYWRVLPAEYFEKHTAPSRDIGHAMVINGFTWNEAKGTGSFMLINSWEVAPQMTVSLVDAREVLYGSFSIEPK